MIQDSTAIVIASNSTPAWAMFGASVVLIIVTGAYAWLTHRIASAARDSANAAERSADAAEKAARASQAAVELEIARDQQRRELLAEELNDLAVMTIHELHSLEEASSAGVPGLRRYGLWEPERPSQIQRLAIKLDHERAAAASASRDLRWLSGVVQRIKHTPLDSKIQARAPNWDEFEGRVDSARESLGKVAAGLDTKQRNDQERGR